MNYQLRNQLCHRVWSGVLAVVAGSAFGSGAYGQYQSEPQASAVTEGSYSVSYMPDCGPIPPEYTCVLANLEERIGSAGSWTVVSSGTGVIAFDHRPQGTYHYRLHVAIYDPAFNLLEFHSPEITVIVDSHVERDSIPEQLAYEYRVREGDIDGDGLLDFFVTRTRGGAPLNGTIDQLLLEQRPGRQFSARVPTVAQSAAAAGWRDSIVEAVLEDFNVDGFVDVALTDVAAVVAGADDQFVYAPGQPGSAEPQGVRPFDTDMARFVADALDYLVDPDYFSDVAPHYFYQSTDWYVYCMPFGAYDPAYYSPDFGLAYYWANQYYWLTGACYVEYYYQVGIYQDFSGFSEAALSLWQNDYLATTGQKDEQAALAQVEADIEQLLEVDIGGWPMEEVLGPAGIHQDPFIRTGLEIGRSILAQARGGRNRTTSRIAPKQEERVPDQIYITGHPLQFARSRGHLALEYTGWHGASGLPGLYETISAGPENDSLINNGKLIGETNRPTDHPLFNLLIAEVEPQTMSDYLYWESYLKARHSNYLSLPTNLKVDYAFLPAPASGSYNSNSYISGITHDSPGNVSIALPPGIGYRYPGWNKPVPDHLFR